MTKSSSNASAQPADLTADSVKACCAAGYSSDAVSVLLGDSYHPGGLALTRHVLGLLDLAPGDRLADVASGRGGSSLLAATEYGVQVDGVDLSDANVAAATTAAATGGLADQVRFRHGDAEALPLPDAAFDAVICECALCTFPDKPTAAREMARVLRPGGRVGISDIAADRARLPVELTGLAAWIACVADARTREEYAGILADGGLRVTTIERHTDALARMIDQIEARLTLLRMTAREQLEGLGLDLARTRPVLHAVRTALGDGVLDYVVLTAVKP